MAMEIDSALVELLEHPWEWRNIGGELMLVTRGGGQKVVLGRLLGGPFKGELAITENGLMRQMQPEDRIPRLISALPDMVAALATIHEKDDRPRYYPLVCDALRRAGL